MTLARMITLTCLAVAFALKADECAPTNSAEIAVARQALRDGLWSVARSHAERVTGELADLIVLESYANESRWEDVRAYLGRIAHPERNPALGYYVAVVSGKIAEAAAYLRAGGSAAGLAEARMLEADLHVGASNEAEAKKCWQDVLSMTNASDRAYALASVNLGDVAAMRKAYARSLSVPLKRTVGLRLARQLLAAKATEAEGAALIRAIVADSPDAEGACDAFVALAAAELSGGKWKEAVSTLSVAAETWPDAVRRCDVQEYRGEAKFRLRQYEEARDAFARAESLSADDATRARAILRQGDALAELGRGAEAMARYRLVLEKYPQTETGLALQRVIRLRELETNGREHYRNYRFDEAMTAFAEVAAEDPSRRARMTYFKALCLYGLGRDDEALKTAREIVDACEDEAIRAEALLWLAKFTYNRRDWRDAVQRFSTFAERYPDNASAPAALLWSARAAFAADDLPRTIQTVTRLAERYPNAPSVPPALLVQAQALIASARFSEAVLVLDRTATDEKASRADRLEARVLKADALFAMGADNPARYQAALDAYRTVRADESLGPGARLSVAFKIGRTLEKLKRKQEATDQYYAQVVLAYRDGCQRGESFGAEGETAFVRAAFRLADDFAAHGRDYQAIGVLKLVVESDVSAAAEAEKRIEQIAKKGRFL